VSAASRFPIPGQRPWPSGSSPEVEYAHPASRQTVTYRCAGHDHTVTLAAEAVPPPVWDCRCGKVATLDGQPAPAQSSRYWRGWGDDPEAGFTDHQRCMRLLYMRRTPAELEQILAERISELEAAR
jgi:hypothetical protein